MGWQQRGNRKYYYRSFNRDGRRVCQYVGAGPLAALEAWEVACRRDAARRDRQARDTLRAELQPLLDLFDTNSRQLDALVRASLIASGYYLHRRYLWRRRGIQRHRAA